KLVTKFGDVHPIGSSNAPSMACQRDALTPPGDLDDLTTCAIPTRLASAVVEVHRKKSPTHWLTSLPLNFADDATLDESLLPGFRQSRGVPGPSSIKLCARSGSSIGRPSVLRR